MYDKYIGIPYLENGRSTSGLDCWGLVRLFYKQEFNIDLPSYVEDYSGSYDPKLPETIENYKDNWTKTCAPKLGDVCLFNMLGEPSHVGIYLGESKFLHSRQDQTSVIESTQRPIWRNRLEGIYSYTPKSSIIQLTGMPHPFKQGKILEFIADGTTVKDCVDFITEKYKISARLVKQIVVFVDGVRVAAEHWATTVLRAGQQVTYKTVPQGKGALRTLLMIAVMVVAIQFGGPLALQLFGTSAPWAVALTKIAISAVGMALVNAIAPIRPPKVETPETSQQLNLFSGTTNRGNPYGAIPVVLGRVNFTAPLGSQPYIDTQTTTSYMHMQLVWGFGPLRVDPNQFYIGASKIDNYYTNNLANEIVPKPVTVQGFVDRTTGLETETAIIENFNKLYPSITEQQFKNVDLVNDPANTEVITFQETQATKIQAIISFPEGLRKINTKDGKSSASSVTIQAELEKIGTTTTTVTEWATATNFTYNAIFSKVPTGYDFDTSSNTYSFLYQKTVFCITPKNGIVAISGTPSQQLNVNPNSDIIKLLKETSLTSLVPDINNTYSFEPVIPNGYKPLYNIVHSRDYFSINGSIIYDLANGINTTTASRTNVLTSGSFSHNGWVFTTNMIIEQSVDSDGNFLAILTRNWSISISPGTLGSSTNSSTNLQPTAGGGVPSVQTIWTTKQMLNAVSTSNNAWGALTGSEKTFMNEYAVWYGTGVVFDQTVVVNFPYDGLYTVQVAADNGGEVTIDGGKPIGITENSYRAWTSLSSGSAPIETNVYVSAGNKSVRIKGVNYELNSVTTPGLSNAGVAVRILFKADNVVNYVPGANYIVIGDNEFVNYKDGFNFPITWDNLVPGQYRVKLTRTSTSDPDYETDHRHSFRTQFLSATAFKSGISIQPPKGVGICRTGLVIESSGKVNGQIDGVNALVETLGWDYITQPDNTKAWVDFQPINNPASLFVHVLGHSANAYRLTLQELVDKIDLPTIQDWHTYCNTAVENVRPVLTYNGVITNTTSVLDVLKDICAAGMASPVFIDGKWSVVIDRPRPHVIQHFTPHNSWGFEATKNLPKLPDALRISFPDEKNGFQITEILVANFGKTIADAKIIEEIQLPGITRLEQARYFARWHLAQMYYRPEIFTINVDFEYLVCTRGDRVKVTHDVPLWGYGSGRIKSISANLTELTFTEPVYLEAGKTYQIRIRTDNLTSTVGSGSIERTIAAISTSGEYSTLTLSSAVDSSVKVDDLFMVGELNKITQDLLVQTISPSSNTTAALTLVEYTDSIYNFQFKPFDDATPELPSYVPTISKRISSDVTKNTIAKSPIILSIESRSEFSEQVSQGNYQNIAIITWENAINLPVIAEKVEFQIVPGNEQFNDNKQIGVYVANKSALSYTVRGLTSSQVYKFRARYTNGSGNIVGPWSAEVGHVIVGKNTNPFSPSDLQITLEGTNIVVKALTTTTEPADHKTYEFRLYRSSSTGDFWDASWDANNMLKVQSRTQAVFNLLKLPSTPASGNVAANRRISYAGVNYTIACRALNNTDNYSVASTLGSITIKTIQ